MSDRYQAFVQKAIFLKNEMSCLVMHLYATLLAAHGYVILDTGHVKQ